MIRASFASRRPRGKVGASDGTHCGVVISLTNPVYRSAHGMRYIPTPLADLNAASAGSPTALLRAGRSSIHARRKATMSSPTHVSDSGSARTHDLIALVSAAVILALGAVGVLGMPSYTSAAPRPLSIDIQSSKPTGTATPSEPRIPKAVPAIKGPAKLPPEQESARD